MAMCFNATASFAAAGGLAIAGTIAIKKAKKQERLVAMVPLLFAIQQFIEGLQWLSPHPSQMSVGLGYAFLFFAFLLWPSYIPLTAFSVEKDPRRKRILGWCIGLGVLVTLTLLLTISTQLLTVNLLSCGIAYNVAVPLGWVGVLLYVIATCGSLSISSFRFLRWFGAAGIASALLTGWIFTQTFTSVWCFFAAMLSLTLVFFFHKNQGRTRILSAKQ